MDQSLAELQAVINGQLPATVGGIPWSTCDYEAQAQAKVDELGTDPTFKQVAALMVSSVNKVEGEAKQCRAVITHHLTETIKTVTKHSGEIIELKEDLVRTKDGLGGLKSGQEDITSKMTWMQEKVSKAHEIACNSRQHSSKGTFILSGEHIPKYSPQENLFHLLTYSLYHKYRISLTYHELKTLHRISGNRILFSLHSRLPGMAYDQLINVMNTNPQRNFKVFVSIQLFEPFQELYYFARRLKFHKVIGYYRLDANGNTWISLTENSRNFKFAGVDQLAKLGVDVPGYVLDEVNQRKSSIIQNEQEMIKQNFEKAFMEKPAPRTDVRSAPQTDVRPDPIPPPNPRPPPTNTSNTTSSASNTPTAAPVLTPTNNGKTQQMKRPASATLSGPAPGIPQPRSATQQTPRYPARNLNPAFNQPQPTSKAHTNLTPTAPKVPPQLIRDCPKMKSPPTSAVFSNFLNTLPPTYPYPIPSYQYSPGQVQQMQQMFGGAQQQHNQYERAFPDQTRMSGQ